MAGWGRWLGRVAAVVVVIGVALAVALAWRLSMGPLVIPGLAARLARGLSSPDMAIEVTIATAELAWDPREREVDLVARRVEVTRAGVPLVRLPAISLKLAGPALLGGRIALREIGVPDPHIVLEAAGARGFGVGLDGSGEQAPPLGALMAAFVQPPADGPLAKLASVEISGGRLEVRPADGRPGFDLRQIDLLLRRESPGLHAAGAARYEIAGATLPMAVAATVTAPAGGDDAVADLPFHVEATVPSVTHGDLARAWPATVAEEARAWVTEHVPRGTARDIRVMVAGALAADGPGHVDGTEAAFDFEDVAVRLDASAPAIDGVRGRARTDGAAWRFEVARGSVGGLTIASAAVDLATGGTAETTVKVRVAVRGDLPHALEVAHGFGVETVSSATAVAGTIDATVAVEVPIGRPFDPARTLVLDGRLRDVAWPRVVGDHSLTDGTFTVSVARRETTLRGDARLAGAPLALVARQAGGASRPVLDVSGRLDERDRAALGFDFRPWLSGVTAVTGNLSGDTAEVTADLRDACVAVGALGIEKAIGVPGTAAARVMLRRSVPVAIEDADVRFGATRLGGRLTLDAAGIAAGRVDGVLGPVPGRAQPSRLTVRLTPARDGGTLTASTDDVDLLFRAMHLEADAVGGRLDFTGTLERGPELSIDGAVEAHDFALLSAPVLARIVAATSVPGMANAFSGRGLPVTRLAGRIAYRAGTVTVTDGTLEGPSLGMRLAGRIDTIGGSLDLRGSVVPSYYGLNTLAGRVPVLGRVFTGSGREGLHVFEFHVEGSTSAPKISVDAISSLAPGAMRDLLRLLPRPTLPGR